MTLPLAPPDCRSGPGPRSPPPTRGSDARGRMSKGRMQRRRPAHHRRIGHPACGGALVLVARRRAEIFSDVSVLQPGQRLFLDGSPLPNEVRRPAVPGSSGPATSSSRYIHAQPLACRPFRRRVQHCSKLRSETRSTTTMRLPDRCMLYVVPGTCGVSKGRHSTLV